MAYNQPVSSRILLRARLAKAASNQLLSLVEFTLIDIGSAYISGSPATNFTCPYAGHYKIECSAWNCGTGDGTIEVISTRSGTPVYDQTYGTPDGCALAYAHFVVPNCVAGDIITLKAYENITASPITSITNNAAQGQGACTIYFYPSN